MDCLNVILSLGQLSTNDPDWPLNCCQSSYPHHIRSKQRQEDVGNGSEVGGDMSEDAGGVDAEDWAGTNEVVTTPGVKIEADTTPRVKIEVDTTPGTEFCGEVSECYLFTSQICIIQK